MDVKTLEVRKLSCYQVIQTCMPKGNSQKLSKTALGWFSPPPTTVKQILTEMQVPHFFLTVTRGLHLLWY